MNTGSESKPEPVFYPVGRFLKPHGVRGEINLQLTTNFALNLDVAVLVFTGENHEPRKISSLREKGKNLLVSFKKMKTRESVMELTNQILYIEEAELPKLGKSEYFQHDLFGLDVYDENGEKVGHLVNILSTGSNDVYVIETSPDSKEILIPALKSVVKEIDIHDGKIIIQLPEWY